MECKKNFMLMILSESHKESNECKRIEIFNNRIKKEKRRFRWQQWGILGNERKFDPVDEGNLFEVIYIMSELLFYVLAKSCASSRGNTGGAA